MNFKFVNLSELSASLFEEHPIWASYYEPDDIDAITNWGINRNEVVEKLEKIGYSDDYIFPMLSIDNEYPFKFEYYKASFELPSGEMLSGYMVGTKARAIGIFTDKEHYVLNINLKKSALDDEKNILKDIGSNAKVMFPLIIRVNSLGLKVSSEFDPNN
jgi:hypothetical protein